MTAIDANRAHAAASARPAARSISPCASCRARSARRCTRSIRSAAPVDDIADDGGRAPERLGAARRNGGATSTRCMPGAPRRTLAASRERSRDFDLRKRGFPRRDRRHGDGRRRGHPRAGRSRRSTSIATAWPAPSAGCRCACSAWRRRPGIAARASSRPRAAAHQHPARHRRGRRDRPALSAARGAARRPGSRRSEPKAVAGAPAHRRRLRAAWSSARARAFRRGRRDHGAQPAPRVRAPRIMGAAYRRSSTAWSRAAGRRRASACASASAQFALDRAALRHHLMPGTVHIIGAGLAGLAAAVRLAAQRRARRRARGDAAGRRPLPLLSTIRVTGMVIDNGNHLLLSGNHAALAYLRDDRRRATGWRAGGRPNSISSISRPARAGQCASMTARMPWWIFDKRPPRAGHALRDYSPLARLMWRPDDTAIGDVDAVLGPALRSPRRAACFSPRSTSSRRTAQPRSPPRCCARRSPPAARPVVR